MPKGSRSVCGARPNSPSDLSSPGLAEREAEFRSLLDGHRLLAFHCTRLFDYEVSAIREGSGLRRLSRKLVDERIDQAHGRGLLSDSERDRCRARNVYAIGEHAHRGRDGQVSLVVGRTILDVDAHGLRPLLGGWGGEATNGGPGPDRDPVLRRLGQPAIIAASIDVNASPRAAYAAPSLAQIFIGATLGLPDAFGEIHLFDDVSVADIVAVWQPGDAEYDRHRELPRS